MKKDSRMTEGSISRKIILFAIPLFLGNLFQQLYNTADSLIVGNFLGSNALAAVSSSGNLIFLMVGFINGIAMGAGVVVARYYGAKIKDCLQKAIHTTVAFGLVAGVVLTVMGMFLAPKILVLMGTPADVLPESIVYFRTYFAGSIGVVMYNIFVGILQSVGDSRHPLIYLIISSCINVVLDIFFIAGLGMGVGSAALATAISQFVSAILCMFHLMRVERYTHVQFTKMSVPRNKSNISVYVYVPENLETFNKDVTLQDRKTKEKYKLTEAGTVISEKTATLTGLKVGDTMTITKDGKNYETKIAAVTENYMGHYIYMTGNVYEQTFGEKPDYSATVFTVKEEYKESESEVGNEILKHPAALSISYTSSLEAQLHRMLGALDTVIIVLIISAGMLAFVVLYNLNNVNITERQRELATLKVLGFYDNEVSAYVYRENVILTLIGVLAGAVFGIFLHRYIIRTVEVDAVMFGRNINPVSFLYCGLLTIGFSMIVNLFMHQKLKKIDMVESLKSVE